jgi:hypothetical protein
LCHGLRDYLTSAPSNRKMATVTNQQNDFEILAARVPRRVVDAIESIAREQDENRSTIVRRLLRRALEQESVDPPQTCSTPRAAR